MKPPEMWILAGPNGAGKTTLAQTHYSDLAGRGDFLNADEIARNFSPSFPDKEAIAAGRKLISRRNEAIRERRSFVIETTLATRSLLRVVETAKNAGYNTGLIYLWVADPELCIQRVASRVADGGHHIPSEVIIRRYWRGNALLPSYLSAVHTAQISSTNETPQMIAKKGRQGLKIFRPDDWQALSFGFP
ncbi:MAG: zeta toxin family protein [Proteobacteria bacterium]|nr:zeta toxin family protein [Pseudomonadota bacterium]